MIQDSEDALGSFIDGSANSADLTKLQQLAAMRSYTLALMDQMQAFCAAEPPDKQGGWTELIDQLQEAVYFMETTGPGSSAKRASQQFTAAQRKAFGKLLRDKRNAAGFS